ncbi:MAG TPA: cation:proton antiporter, partial [Thermoanaerobaculia bacterium]|nr:cation:proton antiporter [Thermoanaerobaculia bacterium]
MPMRKTWIALALLAAVLLLHGGLRAGAQPSATGAEPPGAHTVPATEDEGEHPAAAGHASPVVPVLLGIVIILTAAKLGGALFERFHQPAVLGELIFGVLLGNLALFGYRGLEFLGTNQGIEILAELGVILLLFDVGLESNLDEMKSVGASSLAVAVLG